MKFIRLDEEQVAQLRVLHKNGQSHRERQRAQAILLNARGMSLEQLSFIFECDRDTVSGWLDDWQAGGAAALSDAARSGRPCLLDEAVQNQVLRAVATPTPNFKGVMMAELKKGM